MKFALYTVKRAWIISATLLNRYTSLLAVLRRGHPGLAEQAQCGQRGAARL